MCKAGINLGYHLDGRMLIMVVFRVILLLFIYQSSLIYIDIYPLGLTSARTAVYDLRNVTILILIFVMGFISTFIVGRSTKNISQVLFFHRSYILSQKSLFVWIILLVIATYMANQSKTIFSGVSYSDEAFKEASWGGWPFLYILSSSYIFTFIKLGKYVRILSLLLLMACIYAFIHGNRSESALIFFMLLWNKKRSLLTRLSVFSAGGVLLAIVGVVRGGSGVSLKLVLTYLLTHIPTVGSSIYSQLVSLNIGMQYYGTSYFYYVGKILPSFIFNAGEHPLYTYIDEYQMKGGFGLVGESFLNFGILGSIIYTIFLAYLIKNRKEAVGIYATIRYYTLLFYLPRIMLYDFIYLWKIFVFFTFFTLYLLFEHEIFHQRKVKR